MATHIEYTPSSSPTGVQQTISFWMKRSELGTDQCIFEARQNGTNLSSVKFNTNDELQIYSENGGTTNVYLKTNRSKLTDQQVEILEGRELKSHEGMIFGQMYADWKNQKGFNLI